MDVLFQFNLTFIIFQLLVFCKSPFLNVIVTISERTTDQVYAKHIKAHQEDSLGYCECNARALPTPLKHALLE